MANQLSSLNVEITADSSRYNTALNDVQKSTKKAANEINKSNNSVTRSLGQVSYQIQDVAVQAQLGTNSMIILAQQGPQIASVFGPTGAIVGGFIAVGAVIASMTGAIDTQVKSIDDLLEGYEKMSEAQQQIAQLDTSEKINDAYMEQISAQVSLTEAQEDYDAALKRFNGTGQGLLDGFFKPTREELIGYERDLIRAQASLDTVNQQLDEYTKKRNEAGATYGSDVLDNAGFITPEDIEMMNKENETAEKEYTQAQEKIRREREALEKVHQTTMQSIAKETQVALNSAELAGAGGEASRLEIRHQQELSAIENRYSEEYRITTEYQDLIIATQEKQQAEVLDLHRKTNEEKRKLDAKAQQDASDAVIGQFQVQADYYESLVGLGEAAGNSYAQMSNNLKGATDEEAKQIKKSFIIQQAGAAASATMSYYMSLAQISATTPEIIAAYTMPGVPGSEAAGIAAAGAFEATQSAKATSALTTSLAGIGATTLGGLASYHKGSEYLPHDQVALVHEGERILQPGINSDLTEFLEGNKGGGAGSGTTISAPINIQGNVTDEKWFSTQLMKQRDVIYSSVKKSEREHPNKRRR